MRHVCALVLSGALAAGAAEAPTLRASNGAVVAAPEIGALDCPQMARVLRDLDLAQYRGPGPLSRGDADWPIFEYEDRLAAAHYLRCTVGTYRLTDPGDAFSRGFGAPLGR